MNQTTKKAILVVSFGTSVNETRMLTIDAIEEAIRLAYPDYRVYRAWSSKIIREKILKRAGVKIDSVALAMQRMMQDSITDVVIQPTYAINGSENERMMTDAAEFSSVFSSIRFGTPLLTSEADSEFLVKAVAKEFSSLAESDLLVLMGHGTTHDANSAYAALNYRMKDLGFANIFLGAMKGSPAIDTLLKIAEQRRPSKVILAPFMIVAGGHVQNDMSSDDPDSWRSKFEAAGYPVECITKGLGQYPKVQELFVRHVADAIASAPIN